MRDYATEVEKTSAEYEAYPSGALDFRVDNFNPPIGETLLIDLGKTYSAGQKIHETPISLLYLFKT